MQSFDRQTEVEAALKNYVITTGRVLTDTECQAYKNQWKENQLFVNQEIQKAVKARLAWSDVVSVTHAENEKHSEQAKKDTFNRLKKLGIAEVELQKMYENCISYLKTNSVITVTFRPHMLGGGLKKIRLLNTWTNNDYDSGPYHTIRNNAEKNIFAFLPDSLKNNFYQNPDVRPRYGTLLLLDSDTPVQQTSNYGDSFIVLKDMYPLNFSHLQN